jgi:hypothetical protein
VPFDTAGTILHISGPGVFSSDPEATFSAVNSFEGVLPAAIIYFGSSTTANIPAEFQVKKGETLFYDAGGGGQVMLLFEDLDLNQPVS